jgi:hypothetical protein
MAGVDQIHALIDVPSDDLGRCVSGIGCYGGVGFVDGCISDVNQFREVVVLVLVVFVAIIVAVVAFIVFVAVVGLLLTGSVALLALTGFALASRIAIASTGIAGLVSLGATPIIRFLVAIAIVFIIEESLEEVVLFVTTGSVIVTLVVSTVAIITRILTRASARITVTRMFGIWVGNITGLVRIDTDTVGILVSLVTCCLIQIEIPRIG